MNSSRSYSKWMTTGPVCRHRNDDRLLGQIEPAQRIEGVEVWVGGAPERSRRERARVRECVHWPATKLLARLDVAEVLARHIHNHTRVEIDVRFLRNALPPRPSIRLWASQVAAPRAASGDAATAHPKHRGNPVVACSLFRGRAAPWQMRVSASRL